MSNAPTTKVRVQVRHSLPLAGSNPNTCSRCGFHDDAHTPTGDAAFCLALQHAKLLSSVTKDDIHRDYLTAVEELSEAVPLIVADAAMSLAECERRVEAERQRAIAIVDANRPSSGARQLERLCDAIVAALEADK